MASKLGEDISRQVCSRHNKFRVQPNLSKDLSNFPFPASDALSQGSHPAKGIKNRNTISPIKRGNSSSSGQQFPPPVSGVSGRKTLGGLPHGSQPKESKQASPKPHLQNGISLNHPAPNKIPRMGSNNRPSRCILSHPDGPRSSEILGIQGRKHLLPIQGSPIRAKTSSKNFLPLNSSSCGRIKKTRNYNLLLPRRLAPSRPVKSHPRVQYRDSDAISQGLGLHGKRKEIEAHANDHPRISGGQDKYSMPCSTPIPPQSGKNSSSGSEALLNLLRICRGLASFPRSTREPDRPHPTMQTSHETSSAAFLETLQTKRPLQGPSHPTIIQNKSISPAVVFSSLLKPGEEDPKAHSNPHSDNRRVKARLGGSHGKPRSLGPMGIERVGPTHQRSRDESSSTSNGQLPTPHCKSLCPSKIGQQHCSIVHKQRGRNKITNSVQSNDGDPFVVSGSSHNSDSSSHSREGQLPCRLPVAREIPPIGMAAKSLNNDENIHSIRTTSDRPLRVNSEQTTSSLLHETPGSPSLRNRLSIDIVERDSCLRLPALSHHSASSGEGEGGRGSPPSHCTMVAEETMVHESNKPVGRDSKNTPLVAKSSESTRDRNLLSESRETVPNTLAHFRKSAADAGLSERAADMAAQFLRSSTRSTYNSRLQRYYRWCSSLQVDPTSASLGKIADFLLVLFDESLSISSIRGYRSAIAAIHTGFGNGETVSNSMFLSRLTRSFFLQNPPKQRLIPRWDLPKVLRALAKSPFEPMHKCSLLNLSIKTVFLIAVASGQRRSLLHALSVRSGHIRWEKDRVRLIPKAGFLAKNQRESSKPCQIVLPSISKFSTVSEDRLWCPFRALKWYIDRTKSIRSSNQLFISSVEPHGPVSPDTVSRWIVQGIKSGGPEALLSDSVRAHDTRGISASWALFQGTSMEEILQAAYWASPNTFVSYYLSDVISQDTRFASAVLSCPHRS